MAIRQLPVEVGTSGNPPALSCYVYGQLFSTGENGWIQVGFSSNAIAQVFCTLITPADPAAALTVRLQGAFANQQYAFVVVY